MRSIASLRYLKYTVLWFVSTCMTIAFMEVAFFNRSPALSFVLGMLGGVTGTAMQFGLRRLERHLGIDPDHHA